jgi:hypothetical protein
MLEYLSHQAAIEFREVIHILYPRVDVTRRGIAGRRCREVGTVVFYLCQMIETAPV